MAPPAGTAACRAHVIVTIRCAGTIDSTSSTSSGRTQLSEPLDPTVTLPVAPGARPGWYTPPSSSTVDHTIGQRGEDRGIAPAVPRRPSVAPVALTIARWWVDVEPAVQRQRPDPRPRGSGPSPARSTSTSAAWLTESAPARSVEATSSMIVTKATRFGSACIPSGSAPDSHPAP